MEICTLNYGDFVQSSENRENSPKLTNTEVQSMIKKGFRLIFFLNKENEPNQLFHVQISKGTGSGYKNFKITVIPENVGKIEKFNIQLSTKIGDVFAYIQHSLIIGKTANTKNVEELKEALLQGKSLGLKEKSKELFNTASMEEMFLLLTKKDVVVIKNSQNQLFGVSVIVNESMNNNSSNEQVFLLDKIESELKQLICSKLSPFEINNVLSTNLKNKDRMGINQNWLEFKYIFENSEIWDRMKLLVDRKTFLELINEINRIVGIFKLYKNTMISEKDKSLLYDSANFLHKMRELSV